MDQRKDRYLNFLRYKFKREIHSKLMIVISVKLSCVVFVDRSACLT